jgi:hypothetical protein
MSQFLRLLADKDKAASLADVCARLRKGEQDARVFSVASEAFDAVPGKPFAYWVSDAVRETFRRLPPFEGDMRTIKQGLATADDFRFVRAWWEVSTDGAAKKWFPFAKGGPYSPFYADFYLVVNWASEGCEISNFFDLRTGKLNSRPQNTSFYFRPGLTWGDRTSSFLSVKPWPAGGVFSVKGSAGFFPVDSLFFALGIMNSRAFNAFLEMLVNAGSAVSRSYQVGVIGIVPYPTANSNLKAHVTELARRGWSLKRALDTIEETSHAFTLPAALRSRLGDFDPPIIEAELVRIQTEIDEIAFDLYGFSDADRASVRDNHGLASGCEANGSADDEGEDEGSAAPVDQTAGLLSWAVGVVLGRFDWRLATGERATPAEPDPFDPLPAKSPGMLPDGTAPFHAHAGILVDDQGHPHDLALLIEEVLTRVDVVVPEEVRRWLQRDFFPLHLQHYSKSRRKGPIYWPLTTTSGSYTLWVYYPNVTSQTLYTAINDFVEPKLKQVGADVAALRNKGSARTRDDEKQFETLQAFELELIELRDALLKFAPTYKPIHDDGVQITAAPLWQLFRHKPWQKVLKDTCAKLEKGDYDWAHLAMNYWPDRVRAKCKTDKSLAIAHGLEHLYVEPEAQPKKPRGRKKAGGDE